jgi:hypothetical protein
MEKLARDLGEGQKKTFYTGRNFPDQVHFVRGRDGKKLNIHTVSFI